MSRVPPVIASRAGVMRACVALAAGLACIWTQAADAQETSALRGSLLSEAATQRAEPLNRPAPAEPLQPLKPPSLAARGLSATQSPAAAAPLLAEDVDEQLAEQAGEPDPVTAAAERARANRQLLLQSRADDFDADQTEKAADKKSAARRGTDPKADTELTTGTVRVKSIDAADLERNTAVRPVSERAPPVEIATRSTDETPYEPTGIRLGTFALRPALEQGIEWTSNATNTAGGSADFVSETMLRLDAASDWARHSASLNAYGTYRTSVTGSGYAEFRGAADAAVDFELGNAFRLGATAGYERAPEDASSPVDIVGAVNRPLRQTLKGSLGLEKTLGKLQLSATGKVNRDTYGDAELAGGGTLSQVDRNQTLYSLALRGGYEISPALAPFLEAEYGRRIYDNTVDSAGFQRSATRYGLRAGLSLDTGEKLKGEVAVGWISEKPDDAALGPVSGLSAEANLDWSPVRGTIVSLTGSTEVEGSTTPGESGSILYSTALSVSRELRANLTGTATLGVDWRNYAGTGNHDFTWKAETSLTWWLNRWLGLKGRARHENTTSTISGRSSQATSVYLGVSLRR